MALQPLIADPNHWDKVGRGRVVQFICTDLEVISWLITDLPEKHKPYSLIVLSNLHLSHREYRREFRVIPIDPLSLRGFRFTPPSAGYPSVISKYWIYSEAVSGRQVHLSDQTDQDLYCSINGFLCLDRSTNSDGVQYQSLVSILDRVRNAVTDEQRNHVEYSEVFKFLRARIIPRLLYSTIHSYADGHEEEDARVLRMTQGAYDAALAGEKFVVKPGRLIATIPPTDPAFVIYRA